MFAWSAMEKNDNGWDLFAVVRSCRAASRPQLQPLPMAEPDEASLTSSYDEIEKLCKPFFSKAQQTKPSRLSCSSSIAGAAAAAPAAPRRPLSQTMYRSKKRRNQQKRVICEVPADGLSTDRWAWRKYGQKPIKGSPYPRGYYRCSSSKGCLARKQVERSRTDPTMFVITYSGEHNHSHPTHRNTLAGSTRQKSPSTAVAGEHGSQPEGSPITPLKREESGEEEEEEEEEEEDEGILLVEDMEVVGEDEVLFMGMQKSQDSPEAPAVTVGAVTEFFGDESCCFDDSFFLHSWSEENNSGGATAGAGRRCNN